MSTVCAPYPSDVSDEEWVLVASYLALVNEQALQREYDLREVFNALRYTNSASVVVVSSGRTPLEIIQTPPPSSASALVMATSGDFG